MDNFTQQLLAKIDKNVATILLGLLGGTVNLMNEKDVSIKSTIRGILTATFVSILASLALADVDIGFSFKAVIIGIAGYTAPLTLRVLRDVYAARLQNLAEMGKSSPKDVIFKGKAPKNVKGDTKIDT